MSSKIENHYNFIIGGLAAELARDKLSLEDQAALDDHDKKIDKAKAELDNDFDDKKEQEIRDSVKNLERAEEAFNNQLVIYYHGLKKISKKDYKM